MMMFLDICVTVKNYYNKETETVLFLAYCKVNI